MMDEKADSGSDSDGPPPNMYTGRVSILAFPTLAQVTMDVPDYEGVDFSTDAFPSSEQDVIECHEYFTATGSPEQVFKHLSEANYSSDDKKAFVWELAGEILVNDEAALRNVLSKLRKENSNLEGLLEGQLEEEGMFQVVQDLSRTNSAFRTQSNSVKTAVESMALRFARDFKSEEDELLGSNMWSEVDRMSLSTRSLTHQASSGIREVVVFEVLKLNKYGKNTIRKLEFVGATNSLGIAKWNKGSQSYYPVDIILTPNTLFHVRLSEKRPLVLEYEYFKSQDLLLRNKKVFRAQFDSGEERERFYRLMQVHMLNKRARGSNAKYNPQPLKITDLEVRQLFRGQKLPEFEVAEHLHRSWMMHKLESGWSYGPELDQKLKTHPAMVPFSELDAAEKQRNTQMVAITFETIYALGFQIEGNEDAKVDQMGDARDKISEELLQLVEFLAENAHDIWAHRKMLEGWKYGMQRDNEKKLHPMLIPYFELDEGEKDLDRDAAFNILGALLDLGYEISKR